MAYDDILGNNEEDILKAIVSEDNLIEAMKYNIEKKEEIIKQMTQEITRLEKELEKATGGV